MALFLAEMSNDIAQDLRKMEKQTLEIIKAQNDYRQQCKTRIENAKTTINENFDEIIRQLRERQNQLLSKLDLDFQNNQEEELSLTKLTSIYNEEKHKLYEWDGDMGSLDEFERAKDIFDAHIATIKQSFPTRIPVINVVVDPGALCQILNQINKVVEIKYGQYYQCDIEKKAKELKIKKIMHNEDFLNKVSRHMAMEPGRRMFWYDMNCQNEKTDVQNWEPVFDLSKKWRSRFDGFVMDSKGNRIRIKDKSLLYQEPPIDSIGNCHVAVTKLKNGCVNWIKSVVEKQTDAMVIAKEKSKSPMSPKVKSPPKKKPVPLSPGSTAAQFINTYAQRNGIQLPQFRFIENDSESGYVFDAELTFAGRVFTSSAKTKKAAKAMCYQLAMKQL